MNADDPSKRTERQLPPQLRWFAMVLALLSMLALLYSFSARNEPAPAKNQTLPAAPLAQIVSAISAGEVKSLTVRGDVLTATKADGSNTKQRGNLIWIEKCLIRMGWKPPTATITVKLLRRMVFWGLMIV